MSQLLNFMFRKFKRHYHTTKRAYSEAAKSGDLSFSLSSHSQDDALMYNETAPDRDKTARFSALVYKFLDDKSDLHYQKVLDLIKSDFPNATSVEELQAIKTGIVRIENGGFPISINEKQFTAKQIFKLIAEAGYFERKEQAQKFFEEIAKIPLAYNLFWYQFRSYSFNAFQIISVIFDLIRKIEDNEEYKTKFTSDESDIKKCIYCLSETGTFNSEEHILPETLVGDEIYLPKGFVCDTCNNGISSQLDEALINYLPIAMLRVPYTNYTKKGNFPKANFQNMSFEKTDPNHIKITAKDKTGKIKNERILEDGKVAFNFSSTGKMQDWKIYARAIYKFALGFVAYDMGHEAALDEKYQSARDFILKGGSFNNNMFVTTKSKPHPKIHVFLDTDFGGTQFFIDIFGVIFKINLEETPLLQKHAALNEVLKFISKNYEFDLISLK